MNKTDLVDAPYLRTDLPEFRPGDTVKVHVRVVEAGRERIQVFQGVVIRRQGAASRRRSPSGRSRSAWAWSGRSPCTRRRSASSRSSRAVTYAGPSSTTSVSAGARRRGSASAGSATTSSPAIAAAEAERAAAGVPPMGPTIRSIRRDDRRRRAEARKLRTPRPKPPSTLRHPRTAPQEPPADATEVVRCPDRAHRGRGPGLVGDRAPVGLRGARGGFTLSEPRPAEQAHRGRSCASFRSCSSSRSPLAIVLKTFVVQAFFIPSGSMEPTLGAGGPRARPEGGVRSRSRRRRRVLGPAGATRSGSRGSSAGSSTGCPARSASNGPSTRTSSSG